MVERGAVRWLTVAVLLVGGCSSDDATSAEDAVSSSDDSSVTTDSDDDATASASNDGVEALSKRDYVAQGNAICGATNAAVDAAFGEFFETTLLMIIGPDEAGNLLEIGVISTDDGPVVVHAMAARPKYLM